MKKNGFIATALIYSFFLVFCAVLLSYISISTHNKNLLRKANDNIRTDINSKTLADIEVGSSIKLNLSSEVFNIKEVEWELFYNQGGTAEFVSSSILLANADIDYINYYLSVLQNECIINKARLLTKEDIYSKIKNNINDVLVLKNILNTTDILGGKVELGNSISYIILDGNTYKKYSYLNSSNDGISLSEFINNNLTNNNITTYNENEVKNLRVVISLPTTINIIGGNGSKGNPYLLNTNTCFADTSLVNKILANGYDNLTDYTIPGEMAATTDEGLRTTEDDYGISYYFRGTVKNNYVVFARKCWQIVRINGDGTIKLILRNNDSAECNVKADKAYIYLNNSIVSTKFNEGTNSNAFIGYKYGQTNGSQYEDTHINQNESAILKKLQNWYNLNGNFTNDEKNTLADTIWCNDKSLFSGSGIAQNASYYNGYYRVNESSNYAPALICPNVNSTYPKISKFTIEDTARGNGNLNSSSKVGLLTADEALFSGFISNNKTNRVESYLLDSTTFPWWTITPSLYNGNAEVFAINTYGRLVSTNVNETLYIKPVIVLKSDVSASGSGTISDPYIIR